MVARKNGSVSILPIRGSTTEVSWCSQPGLVLLAAAVVVDGEQHGAASRAAAPSHTVDRPQYEPTSRNGSPGTAAPAATAASYSASPSSARHEPLGGQRVRAQRGVEAHHWSQWMMLSASDGRRA